MKQTLMDRIRSRLWRLKGDTIRWAARHVPARVKLQIVNDAVLEHSNTNDWDTKAIDMLSEMYKHHRLHSIDGKRYQS